MPYWRLSSFYFSYFAALGALIPFWGLYLQGRGFSSREIGVLMAFLMATKIVAPNVWGWFADRNRRRMSMIRLAALLALVSFLGIFWTRGFWEIALITGLFGFFWNASLPQMEAVTLNHLGSEIQRYGAIRAWGSIGFILAVLAIGLLVERLGTQVVPYPILGGYLGIWLASLSIREPRPSRRDPEAGEALWSLVRRPEVAALLLSAFFMQVSHGAYYTFYSIHLRTEGYSSTLIGILWAWGVIAEVILFLVVPRFLDRFGPGRILSVSLGLAVVRWVLIGGFPAVPAIQFFAQTLHAATFGAFHASAIHLVHRYFQGATQGRGQALYNSLGFGMGGAVGALSSGLLWNTLGASLSFSLSACLAALGGLVAWRWIDRRPNAG